jgi:hypothetical protein
LILNTIKHIVLFHRSRPLPDLIPVKNRSLTPAQYGALAIVYAHNLGDHTKASEYRTKAAAIRKKLGTNEFSSA